MTETQTLTLTDFLLARIAEDEAVARAAVDSSGYETSPDGRWEFEEVPYEGVWPRSPDAEFDLGADSTWTLHCARHHPARVLAEVEAKRRIVEIHELGSEKGTGSGCYVCDWHSEYGFNNGAGPCDTLRALALPYADHPDFREEWRA